MVVQCLLGSLVASLAIAAVPQQSSRTEGIALLKRASRLHAEEQYAEAIAAYDRASGKLPQIADWISVFAASSASHLGDTLQVARRLRSVEPEMADWAWRARVRAFEKAGATSRALDVARAATRSAVIHTRSDAWYLVADLRGSLSAEERIQAGRAHMRDGDVSVGIRDLERAIDSGELDAKTIGDVRYELGRVLFSIGKYKDAAAQLARVPASHDRAADARFLMARTRYRMGQPDEGKRIFRSVIDDHATTAAATRALYFLADLAHDDGDATAAARMFEQAARAPVRTDESSLALMRAGHIAFFQKNYAKAYEIFEEYRTRFPNGEYRDQARYWAAQSAERNGNSAKANELLRTLHTASPVSYYAMLAAAQLEEDDWLTDLPAGPRTDDATLKDVRTAVDRWDLLRAVDWNEAAAFEFNRIRKHFTGNQPAIYQLAEEALKRDAPHLAIGTGRDLISAGASWDKRLLKIMYPLPYESLIRREARANSVDPWFVAALIRQESRFNKDATSGAGAIGLMQVMPSTGKQLRKKTGVKKVTAASLRQPSVNIKLGTKFLADLVRMYPGRPDLVLVAYNAGPTRAYRWREFPEFGSPELFIERIPFEETRDYVKVVTLNTAVYKSLYRASITGD